MPITQTVLIPSKIAENFQNAQYKASVIGNGVTTIIDALTATNFSAASATISINLVTSGDTAGNQNLISKTVTLLPAAVYAFPEIVGQTLMSGDYISTIASVANAITIRASGREIS